MTEGDYLAEKEILHRIISNFPDHHIRSEESGWNGKEGDWLWLVDPLDGPNNIVIGYPYFWCFNYFIV